MTTPSSNVGADASHKSVPEWAKVEAVKRLNEAAGDLYYSLPADAENHSVIAVATLIAEHEEPPVEPLAVGLADAMNHSVDRLGIFEPDEAEDLIAELGRRGFKIVEASK